MRPWLFLFSIMIGTFACGQKNETALRNSLNEHRKQLSNLRLIGHKGCGDAPAFGYKNYIGNSLGSVIHAIKRTAGSEIDIQMSKDSTLWVFHDHEIKNCEEKLVNISQQSDIEIQNSSNCWYGGQVVTLIELKDTLSQIDLKDKVLSLDLKVLQNELAVSNFGGYENLAKVVIQKSKILEELKGFRILAEVPNERYIPIFEEESHFKTYLLALNRETIANSKYNNFSADINLFDQTFLNESKSLNLQLWTVNTLEDMLISTQINAEYIQTDNIPLADFVKQMGDEELKSEVLVTKESLGTETKGEFIDIVHLKVDELQSNFVLEFGIDSISKFDPKLSLVYSGKNLKGESILWEAYPLKKDKKTFYKFIDIDQLKELNCNLLKIYIWNQNKANFKFNNIQLVKWYH